MSTVRLFRQTGLQLDAQLGQAIFDNGSRYPSGQVPFGVRLGRSDRVHAYCRSSPCGIDYYGVITVRNREFRSISITLRSSALCSHNRGTDRFGRSSSRKVASLDVDRVAVTGSEQCSVTCTASSRRPIPPDAEGPVIQLSSSRELAVPDRSVCECAVTFEIAGTTVIRRSCRLKSTTPCRIRSFSTCSLRFRLLPHRRASDQLGEWTGSVDFAIQSTGITR